MGFSITLIRMLGIRQSGGGPTSKTIMETKISFKYIILRLWIIILL